MHSWVNIYGWLWAIMLVTAPVVCIRGLIKPPTPQVLGPSSRIFILGFLLSALQLFALATTTLVPLAAAVFFAPLIFAVAAFRPSILSPKGPRIYLICCMAVGELFWIWAEWDQFVRFSH